MTHFAIPSIFWTTIVAVVFTLSLTTLIGRLYSNLLPFKLRATARYYLAPALGLATVTILVSWLGRYVPLGDSILLPCIIIAALTLALAFEIDKGQALRQAMVVSAFGMVCGISLFGALLIFGAINTHTDAFSYLAHGEWLHNHAFSETIPLDKVTPYSTQISMYQHAGLRMGASFLLASIQSLLNLRWTYDAYPGVVITGVTTCCIAIGFPIAQQLRTLPRYIRLALLASPALSVGGLVFGANMGFLPQTMGLAMGAPLLFIIGSTMKWAASASSKRPEISMAAIPAAVLFSAATFSYSEIIPFLALAIIISALLLAIRFRAWGRLLFLALVFSSLSLILLNTELARALAALRTQSTIVVGSPVDWSLIGYVSHAFGVHGGAWDIFQWTNPGFSRLQVAVGIAYVVLVGLILLSGVRTIGRATLSGPMMPTVIIVAMFAVGTIYFRYFVPSPFAKGIGQSWSQFKLAEWANPFAMAILLLAFTNLRHLFGKLFGRLVIVLFALCFVGASFVSVSRIKPFMHYYTGVHDLGRYYLKFRNTIFDVCPANAPIYLALDGEDMKFKELAALYLHDREVESNWSGDVYIFPSLPADLRTQDPVVGDCVVESLTQPRMLNTGSKFGTLRIGVFDGRGQVQIASASGAFDRESSGQDWWRWVGSKVDFKLDTRFIAKDATQTNVHFEYMTRSDQNLLVHFIKRDGSTQELSLFGKAGTPSIFDKVIDIPAAELSDIMIESDGKATQLSDRDTRMAAWVIRNLTITPVLR